MTHGTIVPWRHDGT